MWRSIKDSMTNVIKMFKATQIEIQPLLSIGQTGCTC